MRHSLNNLLFNALVYGCDLLFGVLVFGLLALALTNPRLGLEPWSVVAWLAILGVPAGAAVLGLGDGLGRWLYDRVKRD
jgi:hypothetical protein